MTEFEPFVAEVETGLSSVICPLSLVHVSVTVLVVFVVPDVVAAVVPVAFAVSEIVVVVDAALFVVASDVVAVALPAVFDTDVGAVLVFDVVAPAVAVQ